MLELNEKGDSLKISREATRKNVIGGPVTGRPAPWDSLVVCVTDRTWNSSEDVAQKREILNKTCGLVEAKRIYFRVLFGWE